MTTTDTTPKPRKANRAVLMAGGAIALLFLGGAIGASGANGPSSTPAPAVTETQTVTKQVTPESCRKALALADQGFGLASQGMGAAAEAFRAVGNFDTAGVTAAGDKITGINDRIGTLAPQYQTAKADCLG